MLCPALKNFFADKNKLQANHCFPIFDSLLKQKRTAASTKLLDFANNNYSKSQKQSHSWKNKATKSLSPTFGSIDGFKKESGGKISCSSSTSNSILSLHIEAYENSTVSDLFDGTKKSFEKNGLSRGNAMQLFTDFESVIQNPFDFPRQKENVEAKTPEVAQYTASQRLLNPNQLLPSKNNKKSIMDQTLSYIKQDINQLIKNSDTALFIQVQACIVPKYEKVPSIFTIPQESPPLPNSTTSTTTTMASESESAASTSLSGNKNYQK